MFHMMLGQVSEKGMALPDTGQNMIIVGKAGRPADRRAARSIRAILTAYVGLVQERSYSSITVGDIVARADIGRSTFYDHFRGKDEVLLTSMSWMFAILADAACADTPDVELEKLVEHFWANRRLARAVLAPTVEPKLRRALADALEARLPQSDDVAERRIASVRIAAGQLGLLGAWTRGELSADAPQVCRALVAGQSS
jgi:AcrR family transcriptional regulator